MWLSEMMKPLQSISFREFYLQSLLSVGLRYTDLRGANVRALSTNTCKLVDYEDCVLVDTEHLNLHDEFGLIANQRPAWFPQDSRAELLKEYEFFYAKYTALP